MSVCVFKNRWTVGKNNTTWYFMDDVHPVKNVQWLQDCTNAKDIHSTSLVSRHIGKKVISPILRAW